MKFWQTSSFIQSLIYSYIINKFKTAIINKIITYKDYIFNLNMFNTSYIWCLYHNLICCIDNFIKITYISNKRVFITTLIL